jgi:hypothetical protein
MTYFQRRRVEIVGHRKPRWDRASIAPVSRRYTFPPKDPVKPHSDLKSLWAARRLERAWT